MRVKIKNGSEYTIEIVKLVISSYKCSSYKCSWWGTQWSFHIRAYAIQAEQLIVKIYARERISVDTFVTSNFKTIRMTSPESVAECKINKNVTVDFSKIFRKTTMMHLMHCDAFNVETIDNEKSKTSRL